jgi:hypothetical protein
MSKLAIASLLIAIERLSGNYVLSPLVLKKTQRYVLYDRIAKVNDCCNTRSTLDGKPKCNGDEKRKQEEQERFKNLNRALRSGVKPLAVLTLPLLTQFQDVRNYTP